MPEFTSKQWEAFQRDGFWVARNFFDQEEMDLLVRTAREDREIDQHSSGREDAAGGSVRLAVWNHPGDGVYGMFARSRRLVESMEALLGGEVYHYHSKMILKDPEVGGAWEWHQDYGYWYHNGCLRPLMASAMIAVDPATRENGCLQVLRGSHELGRIDHNRVGGQAGADLERVEQALKLYELVHVELEPGDTLFFHCNLLHRSDQNRSSNPRWAMICCYNAARNDPFRESHHPRYTPLHKVPDSAIKEVGMRRFAESGEVGWMKRHDDHSIPEEPRQASRVEAS
ncbi:MAG: phytanoyl-CoA dioxygenase family protein [bacterium]